ncbi:MAG: hypothetical protein ACEQSB_01045 [Undibacterium sp.]
MQILRWLMLLAFCTGLPYVASARDFLPTTKECHEASEFIEHAAMSRDNGYSKEKLVGRFDEDIMILSGMDPEKRWFVRSPGAMQFLRRALVDVFSAKKRPQDHGSTFLRSCMMHVIAISPEDL